MRFTERSPIEAGFSEIFERRLRPALTRMEADRVQLLATARRRVILIAGAVLVIIVAANAIFSEADWILFLSISLLIAGGVLGTMAWADAAQTWTASVGDLLMPAICEHVGDLTHDPKGGAGFPLRRFSALGLVPKFDRSSLEDHVEGRYRDTAFELVEATLAEKTRNSDGNDRTTTVFGGLFFHIEVPMEIHDPIVIARDHGRLGNHLSTMFSGGKKAGMPRVDMQHEPFEQAFEVFSDNIAETRRILPPAFLDNLLAIGAAHGGTAGAKAMTAGFAARSFYLALERSETFLQPGGLTTPVADMEEPIHRIFADLQIIHDIIDRLHGTPA